MDKLKEFLKSTLIGGLLVVLPLGIFIAALVWVFRLVEKIIAPLTKLVIQQGLAQKYVADILVIALIITGCFVIGVLVRTRLGKWLYGTVETRFLKKAPGYSLIKETVFQFLGKKKSPFSSVALVQIFENDTMVNPTSGNIYHLNEKFVHPVKIPVEEAMRSIISCGAGSAALIANMQDKTSLKTNDLHD